jgi:transposase
MRNRLQIDVPRFGVPAGQRLLHPIEGMCYQTAHGTEKSLRYDRMSGLDSEQLDELVRRIEEQLEEPWHKGIGRPRDLSLREAAIVASGYMRQNMIQEVWAEIFDTSQSVISQTVKKFTPLIESATDEDRPTAEQAREAVAREQTVLVDGFLAPTWSWRDTPGLWSGKHKTTGFNGQAIASLRGDLLFVSEPVTGHNHDMTALAETETADIMQAAFSGIGDKGYQGSGFITPFKKPAGGKLLDWQKEFNAQVSRLRAPVERAIAHLKSWRILHTDYRRPLRTYSTSYRAAVGLYFFKLNFE